MGDGSEVSRREAMANIPMRLRAMVFIFDLLSEIKPRIYTNLHESKAQD
jgi:hypothetical protein